MRRKMRLGAKLMLAFLAVGVIPLLAMGIISLVKASGGLSKQAFSMLESARDMKKAQTEKFFLRRREDMDVIVNTVRAMRNSAFEKLETARELKKAQVEGFLAKLHADILTLSKSEDVYNMYRQVKLYHDSIHPGESAPLDTSTPEYERIYRAYGDFLTQFVKTHGYYDLYVICAAHGHVLFSVEKGPDLGTNLGSGPYSHEGLARLWKKVLDKRGVVIEDFSEYSANNGQQTAFIGSPLYDGSGSLLGVIALQIPKAPIDMIVQRREGMGKSGETFLAGKAGGLTGLRSDMTTVGNGKYVIGYETTTPYIEKALSGAKGRGVYTDSTGNLVMVAYDSLAADGLNWACVTRMNMEEAIAPGEAGRKKDYFTEYVEKSGYYDLLMIHPVGKVFYSVAHEADYGTNLLNGKYAQTGLGILVQKLLKEKRFAT